MLGTLIDKEVVEQRTTKGTLGQHTLHSVLQNTLYTERLLAELSGSVETLTTGIARVAGIDLVSLFLTSEYHLLCIDDDNVVTTVLVRSEGGLVLSADNLSYFRCEAAYYLIGSVDNDPFLLLASSFLRYGNGLVT